MFNVTSAELHFVLKIFVDIGDVIGVDVLDTVAGLIARFSYDFLFRVV